MYHMAVNFLGSDVNALVVFLPYKYFEHFVEIAFFKNLGELSETLLMLKKLCSSQILHI